MGLICTKLSLLDNIFLWNTTDRILFKKKIPTKSSVAGTRSQTDGRTDGLWLHTSFLFSFSKKKRHPKIKELFASAVAGLRWENSGSEKNGCKERSSFNVLVIDFIMNFVFTKFKNFSSFFKRLKEIRSALSSRCTDTYTRVGTLIVATIYLRLIQNRYMFRSFTVFQCSHQHCVQPVSSDVEGVGYLKQRLLCW